MTEGAAILQQMIYTKGYQQNEELRKSFCALANATFGIDFEEWYQKGYWNERYIPHSFVWQGQVVANVSVNLLTLVIHGEKKKAIQIGTVMTHPDYRRQGLSARLMNLILEEYENDYEIMYLFANASVMDFYPRFGFRRVEESQFSAAITPRPAVDRTGLRQLDISRPEDLDFIARFAAQRRSVSQRFGTEDSAGIFMFYALYVYGQDLYYLEDEDVVVMYRHENECLHMYDLVSQKEVDLQAIIEKLAGVDTTKVVFYFTPEDERIETERTAWDNGLFVRVNGDQLYPVQINHPLTSIA